MTSVNRTRKTPEQRIKQAQDALSRAKKAQRAADTREKTVVGSIAIDWLKSNPEAARAFISHIINSGMKGNDLSGIKPFLQQLRQVIQSNVSS